MPDKALIPPGVLDTTGSSCAACVVFPPVILLPLKTGTDVKHTSCHQAVFAFSGAAVQRIVGTLSRAAASALRSIAPRFAASMRFIRMMVEFRRLNSGVKPQKFNKRFFCLCCFYSNVWFLKTLHHLDGTLQKACWPVPYIYRPFENSIR